MPVVGAGRAWMVLGRVDIGEPGRYEVVYDDGVLGVRRVGDPGGSPMAVDDAGVAHPCRPCRCCGGCACAGTGHDSAVCPACAWFGEWAAAAGPALERYLAAIGRPGVFVQTAGCTHVPGCRSLSATIAGARQVLDAGCDHQLNPEHLPRVPQLCQRPPGRKRCRVCCPDVVPAGRNPVRGEHGRFVARHDPQDLTGPGTNRAPANP